MNLKYENYNDGYYHIGADIEKDPEAVIFCVWSRRGPGKTYSALWYAYYNKITLVYMKRTIEDVTTICAGNDDIEFDMSPYVPLNRDKGLNIKPIKIKDGIGGFYECDEDGKPNGKPIAFILALSAIKKFKGFDLSMCDWIVLDEFIPQAGEIIKRTEGEQLLDLYMTVSRDRQKRGKDAVKLILFANAEEISTPITNTFELVDNMADLSASGKTHMYLEDRDILLHHITNEEVPLQESEKKGIYKAMQGTAWFEKSFNGSFSNNDFSNINRQSLKGSKPYIHLHYKNNDYYIYLNQHTGCYYMCSSRGDCIFSYDLNKENDQKGFYIQHCIDLRNSCIEDKMKFQKYTMYDLIINYRKFFSV